MTLGGHSNGWCLSHLVSLCISNWCITYAIIKPPWAKVTMDGFIDFLRRYWLHLAMVLLIYNAKDFLDEVDRILMANTDGMLNMTPWIYAIEGNMVLWVQETFRSDW